MTHLPGVATAAHDAAWEIRFRDRQGFRRAVAELPPGPVTDYLRARVAHSEGRLDDALRLCDEAEQGLPEIDPWRARLLETRGNVLNELGLDVQAQASLAEADEIYHGCGDLLGQASVRQNIATLNFHDPQSALEIYREALVLAERLGRRDLCGIILLNIEEVGANLGMPLEERAQLARDAQEMVRDEWPDMLAEAVATQVHIALQRDDLEGAAALAQTLPAPTGQLGRRVRIYAAQAAVAMRAGEPEQAVAILEKAVADEPGETDLVHLYQDLSQAHEAAGHLTAALEAARCALAHSLALAESRSRTAARALDVWHRTSLLRQDKVREEQRARALEASLAELRQAHEHIRELNVRDSLTGLHNRQHLMERGGVLVAGASPQRPVALALLDLDKFKSINDTYGHVAGDLVLRTFAQVLRAHLPATDLVARYGGEEFVVVRPTPTDGAGRRLEDDLAGLRPLARDARSRDERGRELPGVTMSIGVVDVVEPDLPDALERADHLMYVAKSSGGDAIRREARATCEHARDACSSP